MMNRNKTMIVFSVLVMSTLTFCFCTPKPSDIDDETVKEIIQRVRKVLLFKHYDPKNIDDDFSKKVFAEYIESMDPSKSFYLQSDVDYFNKDLYQLDDYFNEEDLSFFHGTTDTLFVRYNEAKKMVDEILEKPLDLDKKEALIVDSDADKYAKTKSELKDKWRKTLKYRVLQEIMKQEEDSTMMGKPLVEMEKKAREDVKDRMDDYFKYITESEKSDYLERYINSFLVLFDPHTSYFSPVSKEDFEERISGQFEGIGAYLQDKKGYATIQELVIGGPAWKTGEIENGDQIIAVAQEGEEPVNIVGMLLKESIRMIKGKKGTIVTLTIKKKDGSTKQVNIERDIVEMEETFARSAIIADEKGDKYGVIYLPQFYANFNGENGHDASEDVKKEIEALKKAKVKGIVLDLRNNGGGLLDEAIDITGLFIEKGPVVQVRSKTGDILVKKDKDPSISYTGPLAVLVNEYSASASEICAAALQDYGRAVVVGSEKTFGKGTVQTFMELDRSFYGDNKYGSVKLTIQKYYRINGGSTQLKGVESDIVLPKAYDSEYGEDKELAPLAWDKIRPAPYDAWKKPTSLDKLRALSEKRINNNPYSNLLAKSEAYFDELEDEKSVPLDYASFKSRYTERKKRSDEFDYFDEYDNHLKITAPAYVMEMEKSDTILAEKRKNWHESLAKDFYLSETVNILKDIK